MKRAKRRDNYGKPWWIEAGAVPHQLTEGDVIKAMSWVANSSRLPRKSLRGQRCVLSRFPTTGQ